MRPAYWGRESGTGIYFDPLSCLKPLGFKGKVDTRCVLLLMLMPWYSWDLSYIY